MKKLVFQIATAGLLICGASAGYAASGNQEPKSAESDSIAAVSAPEATAQNRLSLFSDELKAREDKAVLNFIERAMFDKVNGIESVRALKVTITKGQPDDFKAVNQATPCHISTFDGKRMEVEWTPGGKTVAIMLPIGYDTANEGSREEIEQRLINLFKQKKETVRTERFISVDTAKLQSYKDGVKMLPGEKYQSRKITQNTYYQADSAGVHPVWDVKELPLESFANLIMLPELDSINPRVKMTVLRHEYGQKDVVELPLRHLLAVCEQEGCLPYWGVEKFENGMLNGALFMYNPTRGYDHIFRIECNLKEILAGKGEMTVRGGIYVPANNVKNLYAPHVQKKDESEQIKIGNK